MAGGRRTRRRRPEVADGFCQRLRQVIAASARTQQAIVRGLGDYRPDTLSHLLCGHAVSVSLDLLVGLGKFARSDGWSIHWLITGDGDARMEDLAAAAGLVPPRCPILAGDLKKAVNQAVQSAIVAKDARS